LEPLSDDAIVVRFGRDTLELEHLVNQAALCYEALGFYGISFYGDNNLSVDEIARLAGKPNQEIRISTWAVSGAPASNWRGEDGSLT